MAHPARLPIPTTIKLYLFDILHWLGDIELPFDEDIANRVMEVIHKGKFESARDEDSIVRINAGNPQIGREVVMAHLNRIASEEYPRSRAITENAFLARNPGIANLYITKLHPKDIACDTDPDDTEEEDAGQRQRHGPR
jgi:hypothetical protein